MNEYIYLPNIGYNNPKETQKLCLAYTKDNFIKHILYKFYLLNIYYVYQEMCAFQINIFKCNADDLFKGKIRYGKITECIEACRNKLLVFSACVFI